MRRCGMVHLTDLDMAVYNIIAEVGPISTPDIINRMSGYQPEMVRQSVRTLRRYEAIVRATTYKGHTFWRCR